VPLLLVALVYPPRFWAAGLVLMAGGEGIRLWAVGHIGLPSRTRGEDVGGLVDSGPYARVRNPLYLGNLLLFAGLGVLLWPAAGFLVPASALEYHFIVRWEEANLRRQLGAPYVDYLARVPRWIPTGTPRPGAWSGARALRSERSTLLAIVVVLVFVTLRSSAL